MKHADWTGNGNSIYKTLGATNHTENEREANDYYATEPKAAELLCAVENLSPAIWECACGAGHRSGGSISFVYMTEPRKETDNGCYRFY